MYNHIHNNKTWSHKTMKEWKRDTQQNFNQRQECRDNLKSRKYGLCNVLRVKHKTCCIVFV
jgi:hypothetical protein